VVGLTLLVRVPVALVHFFSSHRSGVHFPLLSIVLPKWLRIIVEKFGYKNSQNTRKILILVTGVGTPRNWTHSVNGNSTKAAGDLMEMFVKQNYNNIEVIKIHSETNLFRSDENIRFARKELVPAIDTIRDDLVSTLGEQWRDNFHITLSFADGAFARQIAIHSCLRMYRPRVLHCWQLKTFWHEGKVCEEDVEAMSFEDMETEPPTGVDDLTLSYTKQSSRVKMVVDEMQTFRREFASVVSSGDSDLNNFWMRKSRKPVLAVLLAGDSEGNLKLFRGTNMEVSMPTGSLCAERNVIGSALANNVGLKRSDLLMVAVLAVSLSTPKSPRSRPESFDLTPPAICLMTNEDLAKISGSDSVSALLPPPNNERKKSAFFEKLDLLETNKSDDESTAATTTPSTTPSASPIRKITMRSYEEATSNKKQKLGAGLRRASSKIVNTNHNDLNPLKPCGSCNEWLKKIAEPNPDFAVITFTDENCAGVYVNNVN